jgi:hypothetical protein
MQLRDCAVVMKQVRDFFKTGHKSSNKKHYVNFDGSEEDDLESRLTVIQLQKVAKRNKNAELAADNRPKVTQSAYKDAKAMLLMPHDHRSGNCEEMSGMSAYLCQEVHDVPQSRLYIATILPPGDHGFCVVTDRKITAPSLKNFETVEAFTKAGAVARWMIIDPWLNVTCYGHEYLDKCNTQLNKWGAAGKRILWSFGSQRGGWYNPDGEYKQKFAAAPLILYPFD